MQEGLKLLIPFDQFESKLQTIIDDGYLLFNSKASTQGELNVLRDELDGWEEKSEAFLLMSFSITKNEFYLEFTHRPNTYGGRRLSVDKIIEKTRYRIQRGVNNLERTKVSCQRFKPIKTQNDKPREVKVFIASPSDAYQERGLLLNSLETKFRREGFEGYCGVRVLVYGWEELASQPGYGQDIINENLLSHVDIVIAVFKHKLGTPVIDPTSKAVRAKSGTVEEILYAIRGNQKGNRPLGMLYFYNEPPVMSFDNVDLDIHVANWKNLLLFKDEIKDDMLYKAYANPEDLLSLCCNDLYKNIMAKF